MSGGPVAGRSPEAARQEDSNIHKEAQNTRKEDMNPLCSLRLFAANSQIDYKLDSDLAVFPFADIPFDFRTVFRSIRPIFRFG
jgi:hypothetical protein